MSFKNITGNFEFKKTLLQTVSSHRIPQSQLFIGHEGSAILQLAIAYIKYINCIKKLNSDSCDECSSCNKINKLIHPNINFIFPIAKVPQIKKDKMISSSLIKEWRQFILANPYGTLKDWSECIQSESKLFSIYREESHEILRSLSYSLFGDGYRFILIWLPEYMGIGTANAMLKILEEPPLNTKFILVSNDAEKIPITIISRMQCHFIKPFSKNEIEYELCNKFSVSQCQAKLSANMVEGNMSEALKISKPDYLNDNFENFKKWMRNCYAKKFNELISQAEEFSKYNKELQKFFCIYCIKMFRNTLFQLYDVKNMISIAEDESIFLERMSRYFSFETILIMVKELEISINKIDRNANSKINFLNLSIKFSKIFK
ncbi:MAG: DNA polymerase III subunit delta [Bacteroidetes bacterium]|nr:DNA polymerase III subunit delta [Bacteroidota bacterium]